jgi:predicted membrane GTPase involved in stress response
MHILPVAPLQVSVSSASQHIAEKLYPIVDAAIAGVSTSVCELLKGHIVVSSLTERDLESAIVLMRTRVSDLQCGSMSVRYLTFPFPQEPYYRVVVTSPEAYMGDVIGDLNKRVGCVEAMHHVDDGVAIKCGVPVAKMIGYDLALSKMTRGRGKTDYAFIGYHYRPREPDSPLPPAVAARA